MLKSQDYLKKKLRHFNFFLAITLMITPTMLEKNLIRFDWAIKYILRDKANFDVLEGF